MCTQMCSSPGRHPEELVKGSKNSVIWNCYPEGLSLAHRLSLSANSGI